MKMGTQRTSAGLAPGFTRLIGDLRGVRVTDQAVFSCQTYEALSFHTADECEPYLRRDIDAPCGEARP